jgi:hypothetical protein
MRLKPHQQEKFQRRRRLLAHERRMRAVEHARHYAETVKRLLVEALLWPCDVLASLTTGPLEAA